MSQVDVPAMRVLLLKNYLSASPSDPLFLDSFLKNIQRSNAEATLDICCVANGAVIPNLHDYQLVVLSGGRVNLLEDGKPQWVLQVLETIRALAKDTIGPKLLGICWGHQAIHYALGGKLAWLEVRPRVSPVSTRITDANTDMPSMQEQNPTHASQIGVQEIQLTTEGQERFEQETLVGLTASNDSYQMIKPTINSIPETAQVSRPIRLRACTRIRTTGTSERNHLVSLKQGHDFPGPPGDDSRDIKMLERR